ncbi:MAG: beta-galactosidase [Aggregatilineales bacterium]
MDSYPPVSAKAPFLWHGGDYNPEQWPPEVWQEDFKLMQQAGMTTATVGVFSWVSLEPAEGVYTFEWLDQIMDGLHAHGLHAVLATPTAAQPAWMSAAYPDVLYADAHGVRHPHGRRVNYCPNSPNYRRLSVKIARALAERYTDHPALLLWHISNEYGGENGANCMCENCAAGFRDWLKVKYETLDALNARWWTRFWGHTYTDWSQLTPPYASGETKIHGLNIDYRRFMTESYLQCYRAERDAIRAITPNVPITTNMMGAYRPLDYRQWAKDVDVIAWDCYPWPNADAAEIAFLHDLNRGLKDGQPFLLMEQTPSSQNWQPVNALKRPGVLRLWSYLAVAHGADSVMYFQWRRGRGGFEKFHGAVVEHSGRSDTRVFREVSQIGAELRTLDSAIVGAATDAKVAILYDWDNRWAIEDASGPVQDKKYLPTVIKHYRALYRKNVAVDVVFPDSDFSGYDLLIAPMLCMIKSGVSEKIEAFVARGGTFVTTYFSGITDESDLAFEGGYPGPLRRVTGVWAEEIDALYPGQPNTIVMVDQSGGYTCDHLADVLHAETARVLATFGSDFYAGMPALTENDFGQGKAYYIASDPNDKFLGDFYSGILTRHEIKPPLEHIPHGVEVAVRVKDGKRLIFILNHNAQPVEVALGGEAFDDLLNGGQLSASVQLAAHDVRILRTV